MRPSRRHFLKTSGMFAAGSLAAPQILKPATLGINRRTSANSKINMGLIACGNRAHEGSRFYAQDERVRFAGFCDPYAARIETIRQKFKESDGIDYEVPAYRDFRDLLQNPDIDAVHIATADHWHVPIALAAARAGKHVYCEKPLGISVEQCLAAWEITKKHHRKFQYGTQNRSMSHVRLGLQLALNGYIGDIKSIYVWAPYGFHGGSATPVLEVPQDFDYDLWLGPAPVKPFSHDRCIRQGELNGIFHIYDYAIGFIAGWGAHPVDQLQWWADHAGMGIPVEYSGSGSIGSGGLFDTITHWDLQCKYANGIPLRFMDSESFRYLKDPDKPKAEGYHGSMLVGEDGWINVYRGGWEFSDNSIRERARDEMKIVLKESDNHCRDFIDSIVNDEEPISNLHGAIQSDLICHLSDIAIRTGRTIKWDPDKQTIIGDAEAKKRMHRPMREPYGLDIRV